MTIQMPPTTNAHCLYLIPGVEDISEPGNGDFITEIRSAIVMYWCPPGQQGNPIHHRCEPLKKFDPRDTEALALQAATDVLNNPQIRRDFIAAMCEQIRGIKDE